VLPADVVGSQRHAGLVLDAANHVEVGQRRLDHQDVGPLLHVEPSLADRLLAVCRIHLVCTPVSEGRGGEGGIAERPSSSSVASWPTMSSRWPPARRPASPDPPARESSSCLTTPQCP